MNHNPTKAYKNLEFLNSPAARPIRILCELEETEQRLASNNVEDTLVFFGSARTKSEEQAKQMMIDAKAAVESGAEGADEQMRAAEAANRTCKYYEASRALARRMTEWSMNKRSGRYYVTSGGGPGIMEAANRGASEHPGGRSVGLGISLPFESGNNPYVTPELSFEFHYFFTRKYWFVYQAKAMVVFPGGFGTMDELFETLTLIQTGKVKKALPIVLFGRDYWNAVLNVRAMADYGTISEKDIKLVFATESVDEAFEYLTGRL